MPSTMYVDGTKLFYPNGTQAILRGVNVPLFDNWDYAPTDYLDQIKQTGANAVRLQWYTEQRNRDSYPSLDLALQHCAELGMVAIIMLADGANSNDDPNGLDKFVAWWTSSYTVALVTKYQNNVIVNIAIEIGSYRWASDPSEFLNQYHVNYAHAISSIRAAGINVPLMIDAPDGGQAAQHHTQRAWLLGQV